MDEKTGGNAAGLEVVVVDDKDQEADEDEDAELAAELAALAAELQTGNRRRLKTACPWLEKYRPSRLCDIAHQSQIVRTLERTVEICSVPNMLFYGPPGTGKTTAALALARQLYGNDPTVIRHNVLELNASTERGIDVIRAKVKAFARFTPKQRSSTPSTNKDASSTSTPSTGKNTSSTSTPSACSANVGPSAARKAVGFKVVILDEADAMTREAQGALRRLMETSSNVTRFFVLCNYISRIIEPIISRCALHRFQPIPPASIVPRLRFIAASERQERSQATLELIAAQAAGDLRRAVSALYQLSIGGGNADKKDELLQVEEAMGVVPEAFMARLRQELLLRQTTENDAGQGATKRGRALAQEVVWAAHCPNRMLERLAYAFSNGNIGFNDVMRSRAVQMIAETEERLTAGNTLHQLAHLFARIIDMTLPVK